MSFDSNGLSIDNEDVFFDGLIAYIFFECSVGMNDEFSFLQINCKRSMSTFRTSIVPYLILSVNDQPVVGFAALYNVNCSVSTSFRSCSRVILFGKVVNGQKK